MDVTGGRREGAMDERMSVSLDVFENKDEYLFFLKKSESL